MTLDLDDIEAARAATPGRWEVATGWGSEEHDTIEAKRPVTGDERSLWPGGVRELCITTITLDNDNAVADRAFIAALSPDVVLELVRVSRLAERIVTEWNKPLGTWAPGSPGPTERVIGAAHELVKAWPK